MMSRTRPPVSAKLWAAETDNLGAEKQGRISSSMVGPCRFTVSKPVLKAKRLWIQRL